MDSATPPDAAGGTARTMLTDRSPIVLVTQALRDLHDQVADMLADAGLLSDTLGAEESGGGDNGEGVY